eukprot:872426-Pelagomonas_calceolata.AAC.2
MSLSLGYLSSTSFQTSYPSLTSWTTVLFNIIAMVSEGGGSWWGAAHREERCRHVVFLPRPHLLDHRALQHHCH